MNLLPYNYFIYLNYLVFLVTGIGGWLISSGSTSINIFLTLTSVVALAALAASQEKDFPSLHLIPARITQLVIFVAAVLTSFCHYFFQVDNSALILLVLIAPAVCLLSLIFVSTEDKAEN